MGVPSFYGKWLRNVPYIGVNLKELPKNKKINNILTDMNGIFHASAQTVFGYGDGVGYMNLRAKLVRKKLAESNGYETLISELYQTIAARILEILTTICQAVHGEKNYEKGMNNLLLCVDGVAVIAKIAQQRGRRFRSAADRDDDQIENNDYSRPYGFDPNVITPGTDFMIGLDDKLQNLLANEDLLNIVKKNIIYSGHMCKGEGEHKLFDFLREGKVQDTDENEAIIIVYGLDADLVMLSLLSTIRNIYLCRENLDSIVSIEALKFGLVSDLSIGEIDDPYSEQGIKLLQDFVVMLYLIGNDFLQRLLAFNDVATSISTMFRIYKAEIYSSGLFLTDKKGNIIWSSMAVFLTNLAEEEADMLKELAVKGLEFPSSALDAAIKKVVKPADHTIVKGKQKQLKDELLITFNYDLFREKWYEHALSPSSDGMKALLNHLELEIIDEEEIHRMAYNYLEGMQWILRYYMTGPTNVTNKYSYSYYHAPLLKDLAFIATNAEKLPTVDDMAVKDNDLKFGYVHQLVSVMPQKSNNLIPYPFNKLCLAEGELADMTPTNFIVDYEGKDKEHLGVAILPFITPTRVINAVGAMLDRKHVMKVSVEPIIIPTENYHRDRERTYSFRPSRGTGGFTFRGTARRGRVHFESRGRGRGRGKSVISNEELVEKDHSVRSHGDHSVRSQGEHSVRSQGEEHSVRSYKDHSVRSYKDHSVRSSREEHSVRSHSDQTKIPFRGRGGFRNNTSRGRGGLNKTTVDNTYDKDTLLM